MFPECDQGFIFLRYILEYFRDPQRFIFNKLIYSGMSNKYISVFRFNGLYISISELDKLYISVLSLRIIIYSILSFNIYISLILRYYIYIFPYSRIMIFKYPGIFYILYISFFSVFKSYLIPVFFFVFLFLCRSQCRKLSSDPQRNI